MATTRAANWEEEFLGQGLSERAKRAGAAYTGPGAGNDLPGQARPVIPFTGGIPDPVALPIDDLAAAAETVLRRDGAAALQYGGAQGFLGLREWMAGHWSQVEGLPLTPDNYTLTTGSAHALANVCETFLNEGDIVIIEAPSFPGSIRTIHSLGCEVHSVPVDADGLNVDALAEKVAEIERSGRRVKLLYTIPTYHNPTGATLTQERRHQLLDLCEQHDILIVEDDAYGEIGFESIPQSLYSLSGGRGVIKIGTFSKTIATGLRVGWCQATPPIIDVLLATRFDMGISPLLLRTIAEFAGDGRYQKHVAGLRKLYAAKRDAMVNALTERAGGLATWQVPDGGFFLWLELNERVSSAKLRLAAEEEGVAYGNGSGFFLDSMAPGGTRGGFFGGNGRSRFVRLAFSYTAIDQIPEGILRLGRAMERAVES